MFRQTWLPIAIACIAFVLSTCGGGPLQPQTYTIVVVDKDNPIDGVTLTVGTPRTIVVTENGGKWTASGLTGRVTVTITVAPCDGCLFTLDDLHGHYTLMNAINASATKTDEATWDPTDFHPSAPSPLPLPAPLTAGATRSQVSTCGRKTSINR